MHIASDHPEDTAAASKNLMELHELWDEWRSFGERKLKGDQVRRLSPVLALWRWHVSCHGHDLDPGDPGILLFQPALSGTGPEGRMLQGFQRPARHLSVIVHGGLSCTH